MSKDSLNTAAVVPSGSESSKIDWLQDNIGVSTDTVVDFGMSLLGAIVIWIVGSIIIRYVHKMVVRGLEKRDIDASLRKFLGSFIGITLKLLLALSALSTLGLELTSFVAIIGAAGLAVGMALSGTLQNFAGGVMLLIFKPFKVGDFIDAQGYSGTVKEIQIFNTILTTPDNKRIIIPNGGLANGSMTNFSAEETRRVDFTFGIGYGDDVDKAKEVLLDLAKKHGKVLDTPAPFVAVSELADSSVNFAVKLWVKSSDYWDVFHYMNEMVYKEFEKHSLNIPFPQMDLHMHSTEALPKEMAN